MVFGLATLGERRRVSCDAVREALSARIDGERASISFKCVDAHLANCLQCRQWRVAVVDQATRLNELAIAARLRSPLDERLISRKRACSGVVRRMVFVSARWGLASVGIVIVLLTALQVLGMAAARGPAVEGHLLGESTAGSLGIGVAMIVVALRPATAAGVIGLLVTYSVVMTAYVVAGVADGTVTVTRELAHLPALVGAILALLVWRSACRPGPLPRDSVPLEPVSSGPTSGIRRSRRGSAA
jgi:predicted anti-sigma-YlaC factor YlaD